MAIAAVRGGVVSIMRSSSALSPAGDPGRATCCRAEIRCRVLQNVPESEYRAVSKNVRPGKGLSVLLSLGPGQSRIMHGLPALAATDGVLSGCGVCWALDIDERACWQPCTEMRPRWPPAEGLASLRALPGHPA